jgi:type VI secretion system secreted protein Hcp
MAFDAFIKIGKIEGESTDSRHAGWIELLDCNLGILQNVSKPVSTAGGAATGRADFSDFRFTKLLDKSSPELALACAAGEHFDNVVVQLCRAGTEKVKFMEFTFSNSIISNVDFNAFGDFPTETVSLAFSKVQWCYTQQGRQGAAPAAMWPPGGIVKRIVGCKTTRRWNMARAVIAKSGDTIDKMISNRGVERHERLTWYAKVRHLNPHIGDLNRI